MTDRDKGHTFHLYSGETIVSRYIVDGVNGRAGDPVKYYAFEVETAGMVLARNGLLVTARCVQ